MRTYDKLLATIFSHQRTGHLRPLFGVTAAGGASAVLQAHVPLAEMFGYIGSLRALSSGRANFSMQFEHYQLAAASVVARNVKQVG